MKFIVTNLPAVIKAMRKVAVSQANALEDGLVEGGLTIQRESQKIVPIDTGALKNSARTRKEGTGFDTEVTVSYGTEYAVFVHENPNARHAPGKTWKYLEKPVRTQAPLIAARIRRKAKVR